MSEKNFYLKPIAKGSSIDHLPAGTALKVLKVIKKIKSTPVTVAIGVQSKRLGRKDIVFIEDRHLAADEISKIALIAPNATINFIEKGSVTKKFTPQLPSIAVDSLDCINPACISSTEKDVKSRFIISGKPFKAKCVYCETIMNEKECRKRIK